jgi:uncharacterized membrane protein
MTRRFVWVPLAILAIPMALYAFAYVIVGRPMYPPDLAASFLSRPWGINPHALMGGIGLLTGAVQFSPALRRRLPVHRILGRIYVVSSLIIGATGMYMAAYSHGGWITHLGFGALGAFLLFTTIAAFVTIRKRDVESHKRWMIRSYALMFAAVMLRLELPLLGMAYDFTTAYRIVSWLCWIPNLLFAEAIINVAIARAPAAPALHYPRP